MSDVCLSIISVFLYHGACVCEEDLVSPICVTDRFNLRTSRVPTSLLAITHSWNFFIGDGILWKKKQQTITLEVFFQ